MTSVNRPSVKISSGSARSMRIPDKGIENAQQQGGDNQVGRSSTTNVAAQNNDRHHHREGVDDPASQKEQDSFCAGLHGFLKKQRFADCFN